MPWRILTFPATPEVERAIERERARLQRDPHGEVEVTRSAAIRSAILRGAPPRRPRPVLLDSEARAAQ